MGSCFCFNTKKSALAKKGSEVLESTTTINQVEKERKNAPILKTVSDSSKFGGMEEKENKLRKALEEERRISREGGKMVRFVTQEKLPARNNYIDAN